MARNQQIKVWCLSTFLLLALVSVTLATIFTQIAVDKTLSTTPYSSVLSKFVQKCRSMCHYDGECKSFAFTKASGSTGDTCDFFDVYASSKTDQTSVALIEKLGATLYSKLFYFNCAQLYQKGFRQSGVYEVVNPVFQQKTLKVYCEMELDGGGWTVFQRRFDGSVEFPTRTWEEYKNGFGTASGEHWLGNEAVHKWTTSEPHDYLVWAEAFDRATAKRKLTGFSLGDEASGYLFRYDTLAPGYDDQPLNAVANDYADLQGASFVTYDMGTDCSDKFGAWWFKGCHRYAMNGPYSNTSTPAVYQGGIIWEHFKGYQECLRKSKLMVRPSWFNN